MTRRMIIGSVLAMAMLCGFATAAEPAKIAVANPAKIFSDMQELKDLRGKMDSEKKLLEGVDREKQEKIRAMQSGRDALKSDTPQFQEKNAELMKTAIEYKAWAEINQQNFQREQKLQLKTLYQKIEQAIAEVAKQKGIDLVLTDQRQDLPEDIDRLNIDQLRAMINGRSVLFSNETVDISSDVLAILDQKYRASAKPQ